MQDSDLDEVLRIENQVYPLPWSRALFLGELAHADRAFYYVLMLADRLRGYAGYWQVVDEVHITTLAVDPEVWQQGWGSRLLKTLLIWAAQKGVMRATLEVRASNQRAIRLYQAMGFETVAIRKAYYNDNQEDALILWANDLQALSSAWDLAGSA
jgi:ribosomal-protein-alanine N-acetyltransferase